MNSGLMDYKNTLMPKRYRSDYFAIVPEEASRCSVLLT